ncbi:MAG: SDR family oxidoreductase [Aquihabitans sp.]
MRRALVVGAAQGIGRATALRLADAGHRVTATWNRTEPEPDAAITWERCDITDAASVDGLFAAADADPYDIVVANAALVLDRLSSRMADADFEAVLAVNLTGTFRVIRAALGPMTARRWGRVVIVSSVGGWHGNSGQANYAASKSGQLGMARALAREVGPRGVTVNVVAPGAIATELITAMSPKLQERWRAMVPAQRMGTADEVSSAIEYLASERAGVVTGALVPVDGGWLA